MKTQKLDLMTEIIGDSHGGQLDRMVEIVGDDIGMFGRRHRHHRHHRRFGQPGYPQPGQPGYVQPGQPGYGQQPPALPPPPAPPMPPAQQPWQQQSYYDPYQGQYVSPNYGTAAPTGPQPTIDVFVGACLNKGMKSARITSHLKGLGCSDKQIARAFDKNLR